MSGAASGGIELVPNLSKERAMTMNPRSASGPGASVHIDAGRLWAGGFATALVAALVAWLGVFICRDVLDLSLTEPAFIFRFSDSFAANYAGTAFLAALLATGLAHLLSLTTPRPRVFFGWIVGLLTVASMVVPFARSGETSGKIATSFINLILGVAIASLLTAVLSRTVVDSERSWQQP